MNSHVKVGASFGRAASGAPNVVHDAGPIRERFSGLATRSTLDQLRKERERPQAHLRYEYGIDGVRAIEVIRKTQREDREAKISYIEGRFRLASKGLDGGFKRASTRPGVMARQPSRTMERERER